MTAGASRPDPSREEGPDAEAMALLKEAGAVLEGHFQLTSGRHAALYIEKFRLLERPALTEALCRRIAEWARRLDPDLVAGPTTGGIILSYEVARLLRRRGIFAEPAEDGREFGRGFSIAPCERVLIVDDVLTTGGSVRDVIAAVRRRGGKPVGVAVLVDRSAGGTDFRLPFFACLTLDLPAYEPGSCPLCAQGKPLKIT